MTLDMDGVLCDFGGSIRKTGKSKEQWMRIDK